MLVLAIETSTPHASVAIGSEQGLVASASLSRSRTAGEFLLPAVESLLTRSGLGYDNLAAVAVGLGPGLFTGMRIGVAAAKTIAQALSVSIVGISSLDLLAFDVRYTERSICPVIDGRRGEVFFSFYRKTPGGIMRVSDYQMGSPRSLVAEIESQSGDTLVLGNGALLYRSQIEEAHKVEFASQANAFPRASALAEIALERVSAGDLDDPFELEPLYLRRSDAKLAWQGRR